MDILIEEEGVKIERITGHGGFFKTKGVGAKILASSINVPISLTETAGEGGAWGMAILALYSMNFNDNLSQFLSQVFESVKETTYQVDENIASGFEIYMKKFSKILKAENIIAE